MGASEYIRGLRERIGHELLILPGVAAVIRDDEGRVLTVRRNDDGELGLPAGIMQPGDTPAEAIVREVWEETGLQVRPTRIVGVVGGPPMRHEYPNGDQTETTCVVFECEVEGGGIAPQDDETSEVAYRDPEEALAGKPLLSAVLAVTQQREAWFERPGRPRPEGDQKMKATPPE